MPARKPSSLVDHERHQSAADRDARASAESALTPKTKLPDKPPAALSGRNHTNAANHWIRLIKLYQEIEGTIATAFDENMLIKYCLVLEECDWLYSIRSEIEKEYRRSAKLLSTVKPKGEQIKDYLNALVQVNALLARLQGFDARLDGKRKLALSLEQSLYLTPRSRAGVAPNEKPNEPKKSGIGKLIDENN